MASSRLLHLVFSPPAALEIASFKNWPFQRYIHVVAARSSSTESQHLLQMKIEGVISEVGGKMVVADMQSTRDGFDYWRNAAIPSNSVVKGLVFAWANMESISTPFKLYADRTVDKKMEGFLQRMVADVKQRITKKGFDLLEGRRLDLRLADEQELMVANECNSDSKQAFDRRLDVDEQESMVQELDKAEAKQVKDGTPEADRRTEPQELEERIEAEQGFNKRLDVQLLGEQEVAKVEKSKGKQERTVVQEHVANEEKSEAMQVQSSAKQKRMVTCTTQQKAAQKDKLENQHVKENEIERKVDQLVSDGQKAMENEKKSETIHRIEEKKDAKMQKAEARKGLAHEQESNELFIRSAACMEQQVVIVRKEEAKTQHVKEKEIQREDTFSVADEQRAMAKEKEPEATHKDEKEEGTKFQKREASKQNYEVKRDHFQQQTDNIVWETRRMGRKVVHIYYDKSSGRRVSL